MYCPLEVTHNIQTEQNCWACAMLRILVTLAERQEDLGKDDLVMEARTVLEDMI
jgi:hypothetical protein